MSGDKKEGGGAMGLGLSEKSGFKAGNTGPTSEKTGIPAKKKSEKVGKHTMK